MEKTTVYLPADLRSALRRAACRRSISEAALIREGIEFVTKPDNAPDPIVPLFHSSHPDLAVRVDEELQGFGES